MANDKPSLTMQRKFLTVSLLLTVATWYWQHEHYHVAVWRDADMFGDMTFTTVDAKPETPGGDIAIDKVESVTAHDLNVGDFNDGKHIVAMHCQIDHPSNAVHNCHIKKGHTLDEAMTDIFTDKRMHSDEPEPK